MFTKNIVIIKMRLLCFIVAEKVISMRNLSLDGATLTVQKATNEGHKGNDINT